MMKKYKCHKTVEAFKITAVDAPAFTPIKAGKFLRGEGITLARFVHQDWVDKHDPQVGGYFIRYDDGYESYSPAEAFESGYTEIVPTYRVDVYSRNNEGRVVVETHIGVTCLTINDAGSLVLTQEPIDNNKTVHCIPRWERIVKVKEEY